MPSALPRSSPGTPPRSVVLIRPDTLGDLVLFSAALSSLRAAWPDARIAVVVRQPFLALGPMLVPGIDWIPTAINPFVEGPLESGEELARLRAEVAARAPDVLLAACPHRHWLDAALAATLPAARRVAFGSDAEDPFFGRQLRFGYGVEPEAVFSETAPGADGGQDWERGYGLVEHLTGRPLGRRPPSLALDAATRERAENVLRELGLAPGRFAAIAAAGFANVAIKTWPAERFAETVAWLHRERGLPALLVGHRGEHAYLETVAATAGTETSRVWVGDEGDLPLLAGLIGSARLYFGNDTGAMHLAAALGVPVAAVFGGGTWPRFQPAARRSISLVNPLPCFGCGWDCPFGDAPCVRAVTAEDACAALGELLDGTGGVGREIRELRQVPPSEMALMGRVAALARERTAAHLAREHQLEETVFLAGEKDGEIEALKGAADERGAAVHEKEAEVDRLAQALAAARTDLAGKDAEIANLARALEERLQLIIRLDRDLRTMVAREKMNVDPPPPAA
jgi:heptosyltransferase-3